MYSISSIGTWFFVFFTLPKGLVHKESCIRLFHYNVRQPRRKIVTPSTNIRPMFRNVTFKEVLQDPTLDGVFFWKKIPFYNHGYLHFQIEFGPRVGSYGRARTRRVTQKSLEQKRIVYDEGRGEKLQHLIPKNHQILWCYRVGSWSTSLKKNVLLLGSNEPCAKETVENKMKNITGPPSFWPADASQYSRKP